jgi:hypothetical protein
MSFSPGPGPNPLKLKDAEWPGATVGACQAACNGGSTCVALRFHGEDKHCHTLSGLVPPPMAHSVFVAGLKNASDKTYTSCVLVKKT